MILGGWRREIWDWYMKRYELHPPTNIHNPQFSTYYLSNIQWTVWKPERQNQCRILNSGFPLKGDLWGVIGDQCDQDPATQHKPQCQDDAYYRFNVKENAECMCGFATCERAHGPWHVQSTLGPSYLFHDHYLGPPLSSNGAHNGLFPWSNDSTRLQKIYAPLSKEISSFGWRCLWWLIQVQLLGLESPLPTAKD